MWFPPEIADAAGAPEPDTPMSQATARIAQVMPIAKPQAAYRLWPAPVPTQVSRPSSKPVQMRKLKYHVKASVDGFLLDEVRMAEGAQSAEEAMRCLHVLDAYGIVLMGRGTYEAHLRAGVEDPYPHLMSYVFSQHWRPRAGSPVEVVADDAAAWVRRLKACPGKDLYLCGDRLAASLFEAGLIDEVIVELNPVLQGSGRRLLPEAMKGRITLLRERSATYDDGKVTLTYRVRNGEDGVEA